MKIYKSSDLTHNRHKVLQAANDGVIIQKLFTNGVVDKEYILIEKCKYDAFIDELVNNK